jgi:tight adherence protein C
MHIAYLFLIFCMVFGLTMLLARWLTPNPVQQRLQQVGGTAAIRPPSGGRSWLLRMLKLSRPLARFSLPDASWEKSPLRQKFMNAGLRGDHAPAIYFGTKTLLALSAPILMWLVLMLSDAGLDSGLTMLALLGAAAGGFYLPNAILGRLVQIRQRVIIENFPDALDLMTICIEAGLAIDATLSRVADEMAATAKALSDELQLVTLELRAGSSKENALRNFAMRTGVEDVATLAAILIQAERFGTSIGQSLRVHSESLRIKRRQRAEEAAAKIALKLLFPLIFCIFPALLMVLLGPAIIQVYRVLLPGIGA